MNKLEAAVLYLLSEGYRITQGLTTRKYYVHTPELKPCTLSGMSEESLITLAYWVLDSQNSF